MSKKGSHYLSLYFGYHDSCITFSSENEILLHLEAERYFRKKHVHVNASQMEELVKIGLMYLNLDISDIDMLYLARWNNQFGEKRVRLLGKLFEPILTNHHQNHIGSSYPSYFKDALIVCADGGSEDGTTKFYFKKEGSIKVVKNFDDDIITGKFYGTITQMVVDPNMGRAHDTYPGKTMGLAACGSYSSDFYKLLSSYWPEINRLHKNGVTDFLKRFDLDDNYDKPWLDKKRTKLAFTAQKFWQEAFMDRIKKYAYLSENICLVGGCALNVLLNSAIAESGLFRRIYITPISGDGGQSLGAILFHNPHIRCDYPYLGRGWGEINNNSEMLIRDLLSHKIVAWFQGRSEIGARSLGHRSFLGLPDSISMRRRLSEKVKKREPYRPVAPIVVADNISKFFATSQSSPYMTFSPLALNKTKILAPAIVHFDGTSRIQTLSDGDNSILHQVLTKIGNKTGAPILMNSSFNLPSEPIVDSPEDAMSTFSNCDADVLYINGKRYEK